MKKLTFTFLLFIFSLSLMFGQTEKVTIFPYSELDGKRSYTEEISQLVMNTFELDKESCEFHRSSVKVITNGKSITSLVVYLMYKDRYSVETAKIYVDENLGATKVVRDYVESEEDFKDVIVSNEKGTCPDETVDMVFSSMETGIPTAMAGLDNLEQQAQQKGYNVKILKGNAENSTAIKNWLACNNLILFGRIGHGLENAIVVYDGQMSYTQFQSLPANSLEGKVLYFNSCLVHNSPMQPAIVGRGVQKFIGGITNLSIGASENVFKCWFGKVANGEAITSSVNSCDQQNPGSNPQWDVYGVSGNGADYLRDNNNNNDTQAPTTPTNLASSNITSSSVSLSWTASSDNVGVDHYTVYRNGSSVGNANGTNYNVTGLAASTTYSFTVKAFDAAGNASNASTAKSVTTLNNGSNDTEAPTSPGNLASSNVSSSSVSLSWRASSDNIGIDHYTVYRNNTSLGNTPSLSYNVTGLSASTTYSFTVKAFDAAGNASGASNAVSVTTEAGSGGEYCAASGNDFSYEWISKVELNGQSKSSNAAGYSDFTSTVINLVQGSNSIILTPGFASSGYNEAWKIWIDLNDDKDFDDSGEQLFSQSGSAAVSGTITIPTTATGQKRMRISMRYSTAPSTCGSFDYGEVEDYTVSFGGVPPGDTEAPTAPSNLTSSNATSTGVSLSWTASTDNVGVHHYTVCRDAGCIGDVTGTSYTVSGLTPATTYSFTVKAYDAAGNESRVSNAVSVTTLDDVTPPTNYCASKGSNSSYFWIAKIGLGSMVKQSGNDNGYADYTSSVASIAKGSSQTFIVRAGYSSYTYTVYWAIWIDYNQNGTFESTELVVNGSTAQTTDASATVTIPTTALSGNTRMRVSMKYGSEATPCETFTYGEVEDYTVSISGSYDGNTILGNTTASNLGFVTESSVSLFPSPVRYTLNAEFSNVAPQSDIRIISATGAILRTIKASGNSMQINVSKLSPGLYILQYNNGLEYKCERFIKE